MSLTVITPTGGRPEAFALLTRSMDRQSFGGSLQWIVVDDCNPPMRKPPLLPMRECCLIEPEPKWKPGQNTQARNLLAALTLVRCDRIAFVEDDDWISPDYLRTLYWRLDQAPLVGETNARYYHVGARRYRVMHNTRHSSLGQCGMRAEMLPWLKAACESKEKFIDLSLFRHVPAHMMKLFPPSGAHVSIKGLPGRPGIGVGHQPLSQGWKTDADLSVLRSWIGEDVELYRSFGEREQAA